MRSTLSAAAVLLSAVQYAGAQTFTACNPLDKTCPADPALGSTHTSDFTQGADSFWTLADGTPMKYTADGANFVIAKASDAPTISASKYIFFGKVSVTTKAAPGTGIVSSFILQSDDLDEIDWEWLGSTDGSVESNFFGKGNTTTYDRAIYHDVADVIGTWHTYTIDWQSSAIKWYIDNALVRTLNYGDALALGGKNYPQTPMQVKLGNWIGCANEAATTDPKYAGTCSWAGGPVDLTQGPFTMLVKSVTIEDASCGPDYTYSDNSGSYQSIKFAGTCGSSSSGSSSSSSVSASASSSSATHSSSAASSSTTKSEAPTTTSKAVTSSKAATSSSAPTTTSAATSSTHAASNGTASSTGSAPATTSPGGPSANAASANQHKYGFLDVAVVAVGLGLGYLVM